MLIRGSSGIVFSPHEIYPSEPQKGPMCGQASRLFMIKQEKCMLRHGALSFFKKRIMDHIEKSACL